MDDVLNLFSASSIRSVRSDWSSISSDSAISIESCPNKSFLSDCHEISTCMLMQLYYLLFLLNLQVYYYACNGIIYNA